MTTSRDQKLIERDLAIGFSDGRFDCRDRIQSTIGRKLDLALILL
jgi:hypothetical protein